MKYQPPKLPPRFPRVGAVGAEARADRAVQLAQVTLGAGGFTLIAGPCAVESQAQIDEAAEAVKKAGAQILRGGAFKPRTSPDTFQGLGLAGVDMLARAADSSGLPFVTEVTSPDMVELMLPRVDAFQIGARNMQNFSLLEAVGNTHTPVILKRHFGATLTEWLHAAEYIAKAGNQSIILCERGIRSFGQETRFTLDLAGAMWARAASRLPVIIDPSHAIGLPSLLPGAAAAALAAGLDGVMLEVHPTPQTARCDAEQALAPADFNALVEHLRPLAAAMGRAI